MRDTSGPYTSVQSAHSDDGCLTSIRTGDVRVNVAITRRIRIFRLFGTLPLDPGPSDDGENTVRSRRTEKRTQRRLASL